jgi:hypothetical protein
MAIATRSMVAMIGESPLLIGSLRCLYLNNFPYSFEGISMFMEYLQGKSQNVFSYFIFVTRGLNNNILRVGL